jgi:hypothetical protein
MVKVELLNIHFHFIFNKEMQFPLRFLNKFEEGEEATESKNIEERHSIIIYYCLSETLQYSYIINTRVLEYE